MGTINCAGTAILWLLVTACAHADDGGTMHQHHGTHSERLIAVDELHHHHHVDLNTDELNAPKSDSASTKFCTGMPMVMGNGFFPQRRPCFVFLVEGWVIDTASKYFLAKSTAYLLGFSLELFRGWVSVRVRVRVRVCTDVCTCVRVCAAAFF